MLIAHVAPEAADQLWSSWSPDPVVLATLAGFSLLYGAGVAAARGRPAIAPAVRRRATAAAGAVVTLAVALASPLDAAAEVLFSVHMVQHLLLSAVAAPLLVLADPRQTVRRTLAPRWRAPADRLARRWAAPARGRRAAPAVVGTLVAVGTLSFWHAPALYEAALRHPPVHAAEHATILAASVLFWSTVIRGVRRSQTLTSVAALAVASVHGAALGSLLALAPAPWYPSHADGARSWDVSALADQQVAGTIMWVPTVVVYLGAMAAILHRALAGSSSALPPEETGPLPGQLSRAASPPSAR